MRIVGFMVARNEEDIVEATVRHNLLTLDALTVVDHGSDDATPGILASLVREGLPLTVERDETLGLSQSRVTTEHARRMFENGADLCVPLDADEFLRMPSRPVFERVVAAAEASVHLAMSWTTYLPRFDAPGDLVARLAHARRPREEQHGIYKVIVRRSLLDQPRAIVCAGNHGVDYGDGSGQLPHDALPPSVVSVAHVPVRSVGQLTAKVAVGRLSRRLAGLDDSATSPHLRDEYDAILAGRPLTREHLTAIVANYSVPPQRRVDPATIAWIEDAFLADIELRYTPAQPPNPLARILTFGERVAAEVARTTGGL
ncbi:MAG TPA: glycosyltransferase family 2 protein [Casimicrobiaceae bacterium]|nr:glycosyltransferase family 2 protein [Casimicrobiaceae bacterium]